MPKLWEVKIDSEVGKMLQGLTKQENKKFGKALQMLKERGHDLDQFGRGEYARVLKGTHPVTLWELRVRAGRSVLRFIYYIDKTDIIHILSGGDKRGMSEALFYKRAIAKAERKIDAANKRGR